MPISESLPIVYLTPVILKTFWSIYIQDGIDFRWVWKFCWDLSNVASSGNWLSRWDCVLSGGTLYPSVNHGNLLTKWKMFFNLCHSPSQSQDEFENFCTNFDILFNQINDELHICSVVTGDFKGALSGLRHFLVTESP